MLQFGSDTAKLLEESYQGRDFSTRRRASLDALAPRPGNHVLDLGCGNGMLTLDMARAVGPAGSVTGIDPSPEMLASARQRCSGRDNVTLIEGLADALPLEGQSLDGAVSLQVFEYIADIPAALAEAHRVLRPGAKLVIGDMHFGTAVWHSAAPDRMAKMLAAWDRHVADPGLPATLPARLREAGFRVVQMAPLTFCDSELRPDGIAAMMLILMRNYAVSNGLAPEDEARAWEAEQHALAREGRFFFALTHFVTVAERP